MASPILSIIGSVLGVIAAVFISRLIARWTNEFKQSQIDSEAKDAQTKANQSDQNLNDQTSKFPKD